MEELADLSKNILVWSSVLFVAVAFVGLVATYKSSSLNSLVRYFSLIRPIYFLFFGIIFFMGVVLLTIRYFAFDFSIALMLIFWFCMLFTSIKAYKISKKKDIFKELRSFLQKKYALDIVLCLTIFLIKQGLF